MTRSRLGNARGQRGGRGGGPHGGGPHGGGPHSGGPHSGGLHRVIGKLTGAGKYSHGTVLSGWTAIGVTCVLVAGTLFGYAAFRDVLDGIKHIKVADLGTRPPRYNNALNILLIGSDSRSGKNAKIGGRDQGQRSDTVMIVHISPGRKHIYVLSFPRDSVVPVYQCAREGIFTGQNEQSGVEQLNSTFSFGGPGCLWKTLEHTTHIRIDDFVEMNFTGFISVINALGGVEVCVPTRIRKTSYDHLKLLPGKHFLKGYKALEFWRLREGFGLSSDLQRIERDQLLMVGIVQRVLKTGVLHSVRKTFGIIQAIVKAHALTTDTGLTPQKILSIGTSMSGVSRKSVQFVEVPTITYPGNDNWVEFDPTQTSGLFSAVAHDVKLPKVHKDKKGTKATETSKNKKGSAGNGSAGKTGAGNGGGGKGGGKPRGGQPETSKPKLLSPTDVNVEVLNGSGVHGIAGVTETALQARGFNVLGATAALTSTGATDFSYIGSVVQYGTAADKAAALTVAAQVKNVKLELDSAVPAGTINLILGKEFTKLAPIRSQPPGNLAKQYSGYTGGVNVCKGYGNAFES